MSDHPLIKAWTEYKVAEGRSRATHFAPDHFKDGIDYLSLVSMEEFEVFMKGQLENDEIREKLGFADVLGWLTAGSNNTPSSATNVRNLPFHQVLKFPPFVDKLRTSIWNALADVLLNARLSGALPEAGCMLFFTDSMASCYIVSYHMHYARPVIEILDRIDQPRGIFELERVRDLKSHRAKNHAKNYLTSGHKIVVQKGVLTHVDRRLDRNVFGPTIDTLLLANILSGYKDRCSVRHFMEIGSGNGHVSSMASAFYTNVERFVTIDVDEHATACTARNLRANLRYFRGTHEVERIYKEFAAVCGPYRSNAFRGCFDLVVSNPPYIDDKDISVENFKERLTEAVAGVELVDTILRTLPDLLSEEGRLLLMVSSVSAASRSLPVPEGFISYPAELGSVCEFEVPFEVEAVLDNPEWAQKLLDDGAISKVGESYTHVLTPLWIERSK